MNGSKCFNGIYSASFIYILTKFKILLFSREEVTTSPPSQKVSRNCAPKVQYLLVTV